MLRKSSKVECYEYNIDLIKSISDLTNIAFKIAKLTDPEYQVKNIYSKEFIQDALNFQIDRLDNIDDDKEKIALLATELNTYFSEKLFEEVDFSATKVLLFSKSNKSVYFFNNAKRNFGNKDNEDEIKENVVTSITRKLMGSNLLDELINALSSPAIAEIITSSKENGLMEFFKNSVVINTKKILDIPYFLFSYLDNSLVRLDPVDQNDIWFNRKKLEKELGIIIPEDALLESVVIIDSEEFEIGLKVSDFVFPITSARIDQYIRTESKLDYYWIQLREVYSLKDNKQPTYSTELIKDFKNLTKKSLLTNLLTHIEKNLYLAKKLLEEHESLEKFFNDILIVDKMAYLESYDFFITAGSNPTNLGVYSHEKLGKDNNAFNLLHWYRNSAGREEHYRDDYGPKKKKGNHVSALRPEIAFYFITKYFEDFLDDIFVDLNLPAISNFHLYNDADYLGEFDFVINNGSKFYFIEAKTTLSKLNILKYQERCNKVIQAFSEFEVEIEFLIIGAHSNSSCEDLQYFINKSHQGMKRYNKHNEILGIKPYNFNVPLKNGRSLKCIAEPDFGYLKKLIKKICQN